jgi:hypothetical protein
MRPAPPRTISGASAPCRDFSCEGKSC